MHQSRADCSSPARSLRAKASTLPPVPVPRSACASPRTSCGQARSGVSAISPSRAHAATSRMAYSAVISGVNPSESDRRSSSCAASPVRQSVIFSSKEAPPSVPRSNGVGLFSL